MRDLFVDVTFEVPRDELDAQLDPSAFLLEKMRDKADRLCAENGARLRTDRVPEIVIREAEQKFTRIGFVLAASRWAVVAPDHIAA